MSRLRQSAARSRRRYRDWIAISLPALGEMASLRRSTVAAMSPARRTGWRGLPGAVTAQVKTIARFRRAFLPSSRRPRASSAGELGRHAESPELVRTPPEIGSPGGPSPQARSGMLVRAGIVLNPIGRHIRRGGRSRVDDRVTSMQANRPGVGTSASRRVFADGRPSSWVRTGGPASSRPRSARTAP